MKVVLGLTPDLAVDLLDLGIEAPPFAGPLFLPVAPGGQSVYEFVVLHGEFAQGIDVVLPDGQVRLDPGKGCFAAGIEVEDMGTGSMVHRGCHWDFIGERNTSRDVWSWDMVAVFTVDGSGKT